MSADLGGNMAPPSTSQATAAAAGLSKHKLLAFHKELRPAKASSSLKRLIKNVNVRPPHHDAPKQASLAPNPPVVSQEKIDKQEYSNDTLDSGKDTDTVGKRKVSMPPVGENLAALHQSRMELRTQKRLNYADHKDDAKWNIEFTNHGAVATPSADKHSPGLSFSREAKKETLISERKHDVNKSGTSKLPATTKSQRKSSQDAPTQQSILVTFFSVPSPDRHPQMAPRKQGDEANRQRSTTTRKRKRKSKNQLDTKLGKKTKLTPECNETLPKDVYYTECGNCKGCRARKDCGTCIQCMRRSIARHKNDPRLVCVKRICLAPLIGRRPQISDLPDPPPSPSKREPEGLRSNSTPRRPVCVRNLKNESRPDPPTV